MIVTAVVKLQSCTTKKDRYGFVQRGRDAHGIARGRIRLYRVTAESWAGVRRVLKRFEVMGFSACNPDTVESHTKDIGAVPARLEAL